MSRSPPGKPRQQRRMTARRTRRRAWTPEAAGALVRAVGRSPHLATLMASTTAPNSAAWRAVGQAMGLHGSGRTVGQLRGKWKSIKVEFYTELAYRSAHGSPSRRPPALYDRMERMWHRAGRPQYRARQHTGAMVRADASIAAAVAAGASPVAQRRRRAGTLSPMEEEQPSYGGSTAQQLSPHSVEELGGDEEEEEEEVAEAHRLSPHFVEELRGDMGDPTTSAAAQQQHPPCSMELRGQRIPPVVSAGWSQVRRQQGAAAQRLWRRATCHCSAMAPRLYASMRGLRQDVLAVLSQHRNLHDRLIYLEGAAHTMLRGLRQYGLTVSSISRYMSPAEKAAVLAAQARLERRSVAMEAAILALLERLGMGPEHWDH